MKLPNPRSSTRVHIVFARTVAARCARAGHVDLVASVTAANEALSHRAEAVEDLLAPVQCALADRDAVRDELREVARAARLRLAGRAVDAARTRPYLDVFPEGIAPLIDAPLGQVPRRFGELASRCVEFLPEGDPIRVEVVEAIGEQLEAWTEATQALQTTRNALAIAKTKRRGAAEAWRGALHHAYAMLLARTGKKGAERFFPRTRRTRKAGPPAVGREAGAEALCAVIGADPLPTGEEAPTRSGVCGAADWAWS